MCPKPGLPSDKTMSPHPRTQPTHAKQNSAGDGGGRVWKVKTNGNTNAACQEDSFVALPDVCRDGAVRGAHG